MTAQAQHIDYEDNDGEDYSPAPQQQTRAGQRWQTHPFVDFINKLCPVGIASFPAECNWLHPDERQPFLHALKFGFRAMEREIDVHALKYLGSGDQKSCLGGEILLHIKQRTIGFGKLFESISLPAFAKGPRDQRGQPLRHSKYGTIIAPGIKADRSNLDFAIKVLVANGVIERRLSEWKGSNGCVAHVYSPMPVEDALTSFIQKAFEEFDRARPARAQDVFACVVQLINERSSEFYAGEGGTEKEREACKTRVANADTLRKRKKAAQPVAAEPVIRKRRERIAA